MKSVTRSTAANGRVFSCLRLCLLVCTVVVAALASASVIPVRPILETESLPVDVDDPSLWLHPTNPTRSLIIGTVKQPSPEGGLAVFNVDGKLLERVREVDRPNNVDVQGDYCVVTERLKQQLRVYRVFPVSPHLRLLGTVPVFSGEEGERSSPMGIGLYERPRDKALFAIVSRKTGPANGYLWQYRLRISGGRVTAEKVGEFGAFSGTGEIEAVAVDDSEGLVYYSDEDSSIRVYRADPESPDASKEVGSFGSTGFRGNREGIAIAGSLVIVTDQLVDGSEYHAFSRKGWQEVAIWKGTAESTDGIEATTRSLGPRFPRGALIVMNTSRHNFQLYAWPD